MAESSTSGKRGVKRGPHGSHGGVGSGDTFRIQEFVDRMENIGWEELMVDQNQTKGQVRAISQRHVSELVTHFMTNEPMELELTVHLDQGDPCCHLFCFSLV